DRDPHAAAARLVGPHALHAGHARAFELAPDGGAAVGPAIEGVVARRHGRNRAQDDGVVTMHEGLYPDDGLRLLAAGVIARPFPERAFLDPVIGRDEPLERDLGVRRYGEARLGPEHDL